MSVDKEKNYIYDSPIIKKMTDALLRDLNTPRVLGLVFENLNVIQESEELLVSVKTFLYKVMGLIFREEKIERTAEVEKLLEERKVARAAKDWLKADSIRKELESLGIEVHDSKI